LLRHVRERLDGEKHSCLYRCIACPRPRLKRIPRLNPYMEYQLRFQSREKSTRFRTTHSVFALRTGMRRRYVRRQPWSVM
jgi:hypothetical protein